MAIMEDENKKSNVSDIKRKKSKGRQKIDIKKIEKTDQRQVTFSKRRTGLFKKAGELSVLTGSEVAIIAFSEGSKPYTFGHPDVNSVVERYLNGGEKSSSNASSSLEHNVMHNNVLGQNYGIKRQLRSEDRGRLDLNELNKSYLEAARQLEEEKRKVKLAAADTTKGSENVSDGLFLLDVNVEKMYQEELEEYLTAMQEMRAKIVNILSLV